MKWILVFALGMVSPILSVGQEHLLFISRSNAAFEKEQAIELTVNEKFTITLNKGDRAIIRMIQPNFLLFDWQLKKEKVLTIA